MNLTSTAAPTRSPTKALLLCGHSEELSLQCATAIRNGAMDFVMELQARKHTVVEELAATLKELDLASLPDLKHAVERLRETLRIEMRTLAESSRSVKNDLVTVGAAQRRLTHVRRFDPVQQSVLPAEGDRLFVCG